MRKLGFSVAAVLLLLAIGWNLAGQPSDPQDSPKEEERLAKVEERLTTIEEALFSQKPSQGPLLSPALEARLNRLETRLDRIEQQTRRYQPGAPASNVQIESRLRALEREVTRLRR